MVRRPVAWVVAVVLLAEAFGVALLNWILGTLVGRQHMSLAGLDPDVMANSSKISGFVFAAYFAFCALVALLVAIRGHRPAGLGRVLLISAAVVHGLLAAVAWGLVGATAFATMVAVMALIVLLLMTHDGYEDGAPTPEGTPRGSGPGPLTPPSVPTTP
ncbi:hypothetical protein DF268_44595 [Streptomyces sp. V2]|uniref:hypothetical protein n=1 Tax=Streptomyces TaxID=1883 RepID=UPI0006EBA711|nr:MULTISPECIES: hypothetical protein [Streptomyces]PWG07187.1 hypothetical protein DF268_44595 [Streptomyces sp. V2]QZZ29831.1 hypothetical protein A7X85_29520 [Streptomyces sp. ST1015]